MTIPRKYLVDKDADGFYHCTTRCVRRAFLCGEDPITGQNFDHRKAWLEKRMLALADIFAVSLYAYAVMDNHYHIVLKLHPQKPKNWSDEQVAERWLKAYPGKLDNPKYASQRQIKKAAILRSKKKLRIYRKRLGKLSWFMARLNEPLARSSNAEDDVKGKFWEARYQSIPLLDETAVLACMAYVDLNPVRSGITTELKESLYTSIKKRLDETLKEYVLSAAPLRPINNSDDESLGAVSLEEYFSLVEWTGRTIIHPDKASIPAHIGSILDGLNLQQDNWLKQIQTLCHHNPTMIGSIERLKQRAHQLGKKWLKGISQSKSLYIQHPTT